MGKNVGLCFVNSTKMYSMHAVPYHEPHLFIGGVAAGVFVLTRLCKVHS